MVRYDNKHGFVAARPAFACDDELGITKSGVQLHAASCPDNSNNPEA